MVTRNKKNRNAIVCEFYKMFIGKINNLLWDAASEEQISTVNEQIRF